jgi:hypothetical protein
MPADRRVRGRDAFTAREWSELPYVGSSCSGMVQPNACVHDVLLGEPCADCADLERQHRREERRAARRRP